SRSTAAVNSKSGSPAVTNGISAFLPCERSFSNSWSITDIRRRTRGASAAVSETSVFLPRCQPRDLRRILVSTTRQTDHNHFLWRPSARQLDRLGNRVRAFDRRQNPLRACQRVKRGQSFVIAAVGVLHTSTVLPIAVFWADAGIVETGRDRMHVASL